MLCESKFKIGLIGSMYFIGVVVTLIFIPALSDMFGRKVIFLVTHFIQIVAQIGFIFSSSLIEGYIF